MHADAVTRIHRRHRFATVMDLTFSLAACALLVFAVTQLLVPIAL